MRHILILLFLLLLSYPLFGQSDANEKEYRYKITSGLLWKSIGKGEIQPKDKGYVGSYKKGVQITTIRISSMISAKVVDATSTTTLIMVISS